MNVCLKKNRPKRTRMDDDDACICIVNSAYFCIRPFVMEVAVMVVCVCVLCV